MTAATRKGMLDLTPNAITVLERRYLVKDDHGTPVEGPEDLFWRVARTVAAPAERAGASAGAAGTVAEGPFEPMATPGWVPYSPPPTKPGPPVRPLSACLAPP